MQVKVIKIGGSILTSSKSYIENSMLIKKFIEENNSVPIIIVSAMKGATDLLLKVAEKGDREAFKSFSEMIMDVVKELGNETLYEKVAYQLERLRKLREGSPSPEKTDLIISFGERISKVILVNALEEVGVKACEVDADKLIVTNNKHGDAEIDLEVTRRNLVVLKELVNEKIVPVIEGFIGRSHSGDITTLGRGGSDYTAASISSILNASQLYLVTDVSGIYSADPIIIKNVRIVRELNYREALEASLFGSKKINPKTFIPLLNSSTEVLIGNWKGFYTRVKNQSNDDSKVKVLGYKFEGDEVKIGIVGEKAPKDPEVVKTLVDTLSSEGIEYNEIYINKSRPSISVSVSNNVFSKALYLLHKNLVEVS